MTTAPRPIPISPQWDDIRSFEDLKASALFCFVEPGTSAPVALVLRVENDNPLTLGHQYGVRIGHDRHGITVDAEFSMEHNHLEFLVEKRGAYLTLDIDRAVLDFLDRANFW